MKKQLLALVPALVFASTAFTRTKTELSPFKQQAETGIAFTENKGQVHDQDYKPRPDVLYGVMTGNMAVHIKNNGVSYQLYSEGHSTDKTRPGNEQRSIYRVDLFWLGHDPGFTRTEEGVLPGYTNYYLENCPTGALNVKSFKSITLHNLYKGIDLHYYEKNGELKHDYIVAPHTDYRQIRLEVQGARISVEEDGSLLLTTPLGKIQEGAPLVYQDKKQLKARWQITNNTLSFEIENYDPAHELIIDPITRLWGTYYGGTADDYGYACTTDAAGNVYIGGYTDSGNGTVIATSGSHQSTFVGFEAFLAKLDANGVRQWGTYYGAGGYEAIYSCATDASGNIYITGETSSYSPANVIATPGSHQPMNGSLGADAFLVKFNSSGVRLWGTYYGGAGLDYGRSCTVDVSGNVYIAGFSTTSSTVMATAGSHQPASYATSSSYDGFLAKFDANGNRQWATYYGEKGSDGAYGCATDALGNVYLAGVTTSTALIATVGSHQPAFSQGNFDAFLVKFNSSGVRQWGTYYGGGGERALTCATDAAGNIFMAGLASTTTGTTVASIGSHQPAYGGFNNDAFLVKFNTSGARQWGTYYGGTQDEQANSCATDAQGNVYLAGTTASSGGTVIATPGSHQPALSNNSDAFLAKFDGNGNRSAGTYYGGLSSDQGNACAIDPAGNVFLAGWAGSTAGIATPGSHQTVKSGQAAYADAFVARFDACNSAPVQPSTLGPVSVCSGIAATFSVASTPGAASYTWALPAGWSGSINGTTISATPGASGVFTVTAGNACGSAPQQTLSVTVNATPTISVNSGSICLGQSFTLVASGADTYTYSPGPVVSPVTNSLYFVTGTSTAGCVSANAAVASVSVYVVPNIHVSTSSAVICAGESATLTATGGLSYTFEPGGMDPQITVSPTVTSTYTLTGNNARGCINTATITQTVDLCTGIRESFKVVPGIKLYPNPGHDVITIELDSDQEIRIVNVTGQLVYSAELGSGTHAINLGDLAKGVYVVQLRNAGNSKALTLIKE